MKEKKKYRPNSINLTQNVIRLQEIQILSQSFKKRNKLMDKANQNK